MNNNTSNLPRTANNPVASQPDTGNKFRQKQSNALWLAVIFVLMVSLGYQFGKDMAIKHNYQDCVAEGRSDCQRYPGN